MYVSFPENRDALRYGTLRFLASYFLVRLEKSLSRALRLIDFQKTSHLLIRKPAVQAFNGYIIAKRSDCVNSHLE